MGGAESTPTKTAASLSLRTAALSFTEGARLGWGEGELAAFCRRELLATGFLVLRDPLSGIFTIEEPGVDPLTLRTLGSSSTSGASAGPLSLGAEPRRPLKLVERARHHVVQGLRGLLAVPSDERFLYGALNGGRVERVRRSGAASTWAPRLHEGSASLSQAVLALFAADLLIDRDVYDHALRICRECGSIGFDAETAGKAVCPEHDVSSRSGERLRSTSAPPVAAAAPGALVRSTASGRVHSASAETSPVMTAFGRPLGLADTQREHVSSKK